MAYTNSSLTQYTWLSPNHSGLRTHAIDRITPHCLVGQASAEGIGEWFSNKDTKASSNYVIDKEGRIGLYVEEKNRSWCSSSNANDQRAVTIECASDTTEPYEFKDVVYQRLIELCVDICKRNGKSKLLWLGSKNKTLNFEPQPDEMILSVHRWFANKSCPGNWMYARMGDLAEKVTAALNDAASSEQAVQEEKEDREELVDADLPFLVKVKIPDLNIRTGPGTNYVRTQFIPVGVYTIVDVKAGRGSTAGWGRLKSGAGWISLDYAERIS